MPLVDGGVFGGLQADNVTEALEQLTSDQIEQFRKVLDLLLIYFNMFDKEQKGYIRANQVGQILRTMGQAFEERDLKQLIKEFDSDGSGEIEFEEFAAMVANFVVAGEDNEGLEDELREAFRLYDKEVCFEGMNGSASSGLQGNGYINVSDLREILRALDDNSLTTAHEQPTTLRALPSLSYLHCPTSSPSSALVEIL
ncbi:EF hand [Aphelenchoides fujianensis]|nr:EF hand [Aphelenchoides fujianensis]